MAMKAATASNIDPANLGQLVDFKDRTDLNPQWLNKWDRVETSLPTISMAAVVAVAETHPAAKADVEEQQAAAGNSLAKAKNPPAPPTLVVSSDYLECRSENPGSARAPGANAGVNKDVTPGPARRLNNVQYGHADNIKRLVDLEKRAAPSDRPASGNSSQMLPN